MLKRIISFFVSLLVLALILSSIGIPAFAAASQSSAATDFTFKDGKMSKDVLRSYVSRAVTHQGFCIEGNGDNGGNVTFDEDLRFLRRIGAKYIGRAATLSWNGSMTKDEIENHFKIAEENAAKAHSADPEFILQAGIFEIAYKGTVESVKIPAYVFEAFGQKTEDRSFNWEKIVYPKGTKAVTGKDIGIGCWGKEDSGTPDIKQLETKMYFYYMITRYIDAGYEAFHMGQAELMMGYDAQYSNHWQTLLNKAREYANKNARRGLALFDCHTAITSGGIMVGNELVFDVQGAGMCPNETKTQDGAYKAELLHYKELDPERDDALSWVGRSSGGKHPLGFDIEENFTIIEFDNYGGNGSYGIATKKAFYNWGFDDVTWFATQPEWYRNQFLKETAEYLATNTLCLDSEGKQQYFLQPVTRRVITPDLEKWYPKLTYTIGADANEDFIFALAKDDSAEVSFNDDGTCKITVKRIYRANRNGDGCPTGFNQEDTIREIFLGANAPEDPELTKVVLPVKYGGTGTVITPSITNPTPDADVIPDAGDLSVKADNSVMLWVVIAIAAISAVAAVAVTVYVMSSNKKLT